MNLKKTFGPQISSNFRKFKSESVKNTNIHWGKNRISVFAFPSAKISAHLRLKGTFLFFILFTFPLFPLGSRAEQTMDSGDALSVAESTAYDRCQKGKWEEALAAEQNALKIAESRYGPTHPSLAPLLAEVATLDRYLALYADAESNLQWALAIREKNYGMGSPLVAESFCDLASLYFDWGHWEEAEFFQRKAVALLDNGTEEPENPENLGQALELLGQIEMELQKKDEALSLLKRSLEIAEKDPAVRPTRLLERKCA